MNEMRHPIHKYINSTVVHSVPYTKGGAIGAAAQGTDLEGTNFKMV